MKKRKMTGRKGGKAKAKGFVKNVKGALKKGMKNMKEAIDFDGK